MKRTLLLSLPAAWVAVGLVLAPPARYLPGAEAKPEYAKKENKACGYCHVRPMGGGPRNEKGIEYERNGHKFAAAATAGGFGEGKAFSSEANAKAFELVRRAMAITHWGDALKRIAELRPKERKSPAAQLLANVEAQIDGKGRDLASAAKEAITSGKTADAANALIRLETEFRGREPAKEVPAIRTSLLKLADGKTAEATAKTNETQRLAWFDAQMKEAEGQKPAAIKVLQDLLARSPTGPFAEDAKRKLEEWGVPAAPNPPPAMGG